VLVTERSRLVLGQRVAISLAVGGAHEGGHDLEIPLADIGRLAPEVGKAEVDVELEQVDTGWALGHVTRVGGGSDGIRGLRSMDMGELKFGPARVPSRASPEAAIELLLERGYSACEVDFEGKFWMDYDWAERFGALARENEIALSVHAPIAGFMGHVERDKKQRMAVGMLDHSAGVAVAAGAEVVVFHPGFLLGRERADAIDSVVEQLAELRERLEGKGRGVPFGVEVMGRVRELGTIDDVVEISRRLGWVRPVLDFAHMHAVTDGGFTETAAFADVLARADKVIERGAPFHVHFSDIAYANRNETKHLAYGEGTLRAEPLGEALAQFDRPATVISESPDEESHQAIRAAVSSGTAPARSSARRSSKPMMSSTRPRSSRN
jgi:deoxyribonuclease-4